MMAFPAHSWFDFGPRLVEAGEGRGRVANILDALAEGECRRATVVIPRAGAPSLTEAGEGFAVALETSGTTGPPKRLRHDFARLVSGVRAGPTEARWLLTFDPASFAGLQIILTVALSGATLVCQPGADVAALSALAASAAVTHISGTPSFWRGFLMAAPRPLPPVQVVTLGGEAADQGVLDHLRAAFPAAVIRHIYASTEAGAVFAVGDGRAGFPAGWLEHGVAGVSLAIREGVLWIRSPRAALDVGAATDDGWIDTGDLVTVADGRVSFAGRRDGRVNVGGVKVSPEAAEALILGVEGVADAVVDAAPSPITGHLLTATIVPSRNADPERLRAAVRDAVAALPPAGRPRIITFADAITLTASGKKSRSAA